MTRSEAAACAAASWQHLTTTLRQLSDEDLNALDPASLDPVEVAVRVRLRRPASSGRG
jgi:hypothetical protein